ncbi:uncharacterized protein VICG_00218 [Vittaforma corneae ATCC 50505]|uniref:Amino acid transporter transmembrane domain-containing protein n=1 Tax=Vittaforma corneae (strain ATCC 50505) TaxID=993615 RepID=L2GPS9_VITCO|nr:uncharacterized protein VICG_00218 [Vittaforma corneae ATCC 50505]ELA42903.1 hypothetical protein VICG_00218 [Vittaforma corneae ATCC 50505]
MAALTEHLIICFGLMKSCIGAGIYSYPHTFNLYGVVWTTILTVLTCAASIFGTYVYIDRNKALQKEHSISTLGAAVVSKNFKYFVDIVVILKCLVVAAGYLNLAKNLIQKISPDADNGILTVDPSVSGFLFTGLGCLLLTPSILSSKLGKLKNLSYIGTLSIILIIALSKIESAGKPLNFEMFTSSPPSIIQNIGLFVFGFSCHQSIMTIHNESIIPETRLKFLIMLSFVCVSCLYLGFGFINYSAFSVINGSPANLEQIFLAWEEKHLVTKLATILFASSLVITVPFQIHPAKSYFIDMFNVSDGYKRLVGISMIVLCYFLTTQSWYNFYFVSNFVAKPLNSLLCFGFPVLFTIYGRFKKSCSDYMICIYLAIFTLACFASYFVSLYKLLTKV